MSGNKPAIGWHAAWALAIGGMIGGGIYTLAGVILSFSGPLASVSLTVGGLLAMLTARSYLALAAQVGEGAVPLELFMRQERTQLAGIASWGLVVFYVFALAVYTFTFGQYVGRALGTHPALVGLAEVTIVAALVVINLLGIRQPVTVQLAAVWMELTTLVALAAVGLFAFRPENLHVGVPAGSATGVIAGAAGTFIAFEGFEMLVYDVKEIRNPLRTLRTALPVAILVVGLAYALVTVGAASLVGADELVRHKETALAYAAKRAMGTTGLVLVTITAATSASSAINATLFCVSRLVRTAAQKEMLPSALAWTNRRACPAAALLALAVLGTGVALFASLESLVQAASFAFLALFTVVNALAWRHVGRGKALSLATAIACAVAAAVVLIQLGRSHVRMLFSLAVAIALALAAHLATTVWRRYRHRTRLVRQT